MVCVKNSFVQFVSQHVWITSEKAPWKWYAEMEGLSRRLLDHRGEHPSGGCFKMVMNADGTRSLGPHGEGVLGPGILPEQH